MVADAGVAEHAHDLLDGLGTAGGLEREVDPAPPVRSRTASTGSVGRRVHRVGRAEVPRPLELLRRDVHGDDALRPRDLRAGDHRQADAAAADDRDGRPRPHGRRVRGRAESGGHAAREQACLLERDLGRHLHGLRRVDDRPVGERSRAERRRERRAVGGAMRAPPRAKVRGAAARIAATARVALPAGGAPRDDDRVAGRDVGDVRRRPPRRGRRPRGRAGSGTAGPSRPSASRAGRCGRRRSPPGGRAPRRVRAGRA